MALPVATATPTAAFVNSFANATDVTGRKPFGDIQWSSTLAVAEEIAVTTAVPDAFLADATFDVWGDVKARLATSIARVFDQAALNGTNAPATYPVGGLAAVAAPVAATTVSDLNEILHAWTEVASRGGAVNAVVSSPQGQAALYSMADDSGRPLYLTSLSEGVTGGLLGVPIYPTRAWNVAGANMLPGDYNYSIVGLRQDITWDTSNDGVITDATGKVVLSAFQDDMTIIRAYARIAYAIGKIDGDAPFALVNLGDTV
jgi:HK97 family phage major capsid protein